MPTVTAEGNVTLQQAGTGPVTGDHVEALGDALSASGGIDTYSALASRLRRAGAAIASRTSPSWQRSPNGCGRARRTWNGRALT
jgi:hypothetical protein